MKKDSVYDAAAWQGAVKLSPTYTLSRVLTHWAVYTLLAFLLYDVLWILTELGDFSSSELLSWKILVEDIAYCAVFSLSSVLVYLAFRQFYAHQYTLRRQMLLNLSLVLVNIALAVVAEYVHGIINPERRYDAFWGDTYVFSFIATIITLLHIAYRYSTLVIEQHKQMAAFREQSLRQQLNPHFVFNNLNTLRGILRQDTARAEEFIVQIAGIYRHILRHLDSDFEPLSQAMEFAQDYVAVQNIRFAHRIKLDLQPFEMREDERVLVMSTQLLLENAIKHNASHAQKLRIRITRQGDELIVSNSLAPQADEVADSFPSYGIGLKNLDERYKITSKRGIQVHHGEKTFSVHIPILSTKDYEGIDY